jgi:hypothetical protein
MWVADNCYERRVCDWGSPQQRFEPACGSGEKNLAMKDVCHGIETREV